MSNTLPKFLKRQGDSILFAGDGELVFYIPENYFTTHNAIIVGEYVNLLGIFDYAVFDASGKHSGLKTFRLPTVFLSKPYQIDKVKAVKLTKNTDQQDYRLLKFKKDDVIIVSTKVPENVANVEDFYQLFLRGNLPGTIQYDKMHEYFTESIGLNGSSYGVSLQMFGIVVSEMCRNPNDLSEPFRLSKIKDMTNYKAISITEVPKYVSPFTSITSENWDEAVVNAIINKEHKDSPMEKILMD